MGLASGQGRLLMLTSRMSDVEYQETMVAHRKQQLAQKSEASAKEYNDAMSNYTMKIKVPDTSESSGQAKKQLSYDTLVGQNYLPTNGNDTIFLKHTSAWTEWNKLSDEEKKTKPEPKDKWDTKGVSGLITIDEKTGTAKIKNDSSNKEYKIADGDAYLSKPEWLQSAIESGMVYLLNTQKKDGEQMDLTMLQSDTNFEYVLDTTDDVEASSKYEYETAKIARQDSRLDMELNQLETQHSAISKEYDSTKEVINSNVDRTFKLFSNG